MNGDKTISSSFGSRYLGVGPRPLSCSRASYFNAPLAYIQDTSSFVAIPSNDKYYYGSKLLEHQPPDSCGRTAIGVSIPPPQKVTSGIKTKI